MRAVLAVLVEQVAHVQIALASRNPAPAEREHEANRAEPLAEGQTASSRPARQAERAGSRRARSANAVGVAQLKRHAQQRIGGDADFAHQAQQLGVGADQDVLAVVELAALDRHAPRPAARHGPRFEDSHRNAASGQGHGGGHARVSSSDDCYALTQVFQASQNLRNGVSEVRCVSTWKPSRSTSASVAR